MEVEITQKEKKKKRSERSSDEDSKDEFEKPDWEEVTLEDFEKKHGVCSENKIVNYFVLFF